MNQKELPAEGPPVVEPPKSLHRLSVLGVCLVFPLIWVGGLVTTYDAGMAVPDWPGTYGYNLFAYPLSTWFWGPFDLFIEHGHRLLGATVGFVAILMLVSAWLKESRRWVTLLVAATLLAVVSQGALGGVRVLLSDRTVAMLHGCFAPVVFVLFVIAATVTHRRWNQSLPAAGSTDSGSTDSGSTDSGSTDSGGADSGSAPIGKPVSRMTLFIAAIPVVLSYTQLVLGAQIRHVQPSTATGTFTLFVALHITIAFVFWGLTPLISLSVRKCGDLTLSRPAGLLIWFVGLQILLGIGTWTVRYGWPSVLAFLPYADGFLVRSKGLVESMIITAHVAVGSLILATSALVLLQAARQFVCHVDPIARS